MAATYGQARFIGLSSRQTYSKGTYFSDSAGALINWDSGAGASSTSDNNWTPPEPVILTDFVLTAATGQTKSQIVRAGVPTGDVLLNALHLSTVTNRPTLGIVFGAGQKIQAIQLA